MSHWPDYKDCTDACAARPDCKVCGRRKPPVGRDVAAASCGSYCTYDCPGMTQEPHAGHLWPEEWREIQEERAALKGEKERGR